MLQTFLLLMKLINISTYNCKSAKRNTGGIKFLCDRSDIVFLQEHWLFESDLPMLNQLHDDFQSFGVSAMKTDERIVVGRPFGGVSVLWKKSLAAHVHPLVFDDSRIIGLNCEFEGRKILLLGIYMPYESHNNFEDFIFYLAKIKVIIDEFPSAHVCVLGDFNADMARRASFGTELNDFCRENSLFVADAMFNNEHSITHLNDGHGTGSWLDHVICSSEFFDSIVDIRIDNTILSSDHFPLTAKIRLELSAPLDAVSAPPDRECWSIDWSSVTSDAKDCYARSVEDRLRNITVPTHALHCTLEDCTEHNNCIDSYYREIINCIQKSSRCISKRNSCKTKIVPGWSEFVQDKHDLLGDVYSLWALVGRPREGYIFEQLRLAKSRFKYALRFCINNEKSLRAKSLANKLVNNPKSATFFWKEIQKLNSVPPLSPAVDGISGAKNIGNLWKDHFSKILNSVDDQSSKAKLLTKLKGQRLADVSLSIDEVKLALSSLATGKSCGPDGLSSENFVYAGNSCSVHLPL